ncbi:MFS transporter [Pseudorhodobacter sp.]|uniref:MFS transporter n=1 Tax=Pseudorhodobacter sp. TaxID=1934400 RepID=UPI002647D081|nr:MFS transporter [Pseudorhodobacter sp.]MDN5785653.1 MFS transporter [Pseudorhodobacter sp.]
MIAAAGLPIYIHAPKFYVDEYGVSLVTLGVVLFGLRLLDVVQDPAFGWLAEKTRAHRRFGVTVAALVLALSMIGLFAIPPLLPPLWWFALTLTGLFSAFSFLTIAFYAQGVAKAATLPGGHLRLASWREAGALVGISLAAIAPTLLGYVIARPFAGFALGFALFVLLASFAMRQQWTAAATGADASPLTVLADPTARRFLALALVNSAPVAVTATLFPFFVESRIGAANLSGPLLLLFFITAALTAPLWGRIAAHFGQRNTLLAGMVLAIIAFAFALTLRTGDVLAFAAISAASGAALAADMVLLPALFARQLAAHKGGEAMGFGLWSFASKLTLAFAALVLFPVLGAYGFTSGSANSAQALHALTLLYAGLPCALKLAAIALVVRTPMQEEPRCSSESRPA